MSFLVNLLTNFLLSSVSDDINKEAKSLHSRALWTEDDDTRVKETIARCHANAKEQIKQEEKQAIKDKIAESKVDKDEVKEHAIDGLVTMGKTKTEAKKMVDEAIREYGKLPLEELVRLSLMKK